MDELQESFDVDDALKPGVVMDTFVLDVSDKGTGIAMVGGKKAFVDGALENELVSLELIAEHHTYWEVKLLAIKSASRYRVESPCRYETCGSCSLMNTMYRHQLSMKNKRLSDALARYGVGDIAIPGCLGQENHWGYRNKGVYYVRAVDDETRIGFFAANSHDVVHVGRCLMEPNWFSEINRCIHDWAVHCKVSAYSEERGTGLLRNVIYREGTGSGDRMMILVCSSEDVPHLNMLMSALRVFHLTSVYLNVNNEPGNGVWGENFKLLAGRDYIETSVSGLKYRLSPRSFWQLNSEQCEKLYSIVMDYAEPTISDVVFDLYCGIGSISMLLAKKAGRVYGIEIVEDAVKDARANAVLNKLGNCEFAAGPSEVLAPQLCARGVKPSIVVVDPPRKGCDKEVLDAIKQTLPAKIVYVSCEPDSLARDIKALEPQYRPVKLRTVDMFPNTMHVETVVLLSRN